MSIELPENNTPAKPERLGKRLSALSGWVKEKLDGKAFVIIDFDWIIKRRFVNFPNNLMIIEEKTVKSFEKYPLCITLGEAHLFNDLLKIIKDSIILPIFIIFIEGEEKRDIKKGVFVCEYQNSFLSDCPKIQLNNYWYLDLKNKCQKISEIELIELYQTAILPLKNSAKLEVTKTGELSLENIYG